MIIVINDHRYCLYTSNIFIVNGRALYYFYGSDSEDGCNRTLFNEIIMLVSFVTSSGDSGGNIMSKNDRKWYTVLLYIVSRARYTNFPSHLTIELVSSFLYLTCNKYNKTFANINILITYAT